MLPGQMLVTHSEPHLHVIWTNVGHSFRTPSPCYLGRWYFFPLPIDTHTILVMVILCKTSFSCTDVCIKIGLMNRIIGEIILWKVYELADNTRPCFLYTEYNLFPLFSCHMFDVSCENKKQPWTYLVDDNFTDDSFHLVAPVTRFSTQRFEGINSFYWNVYSCCQFWNNKQHFTYD